MTEYTTHVPSSYEEFEFTCPKCNSKNMSIKVNEEGFFYFFECHKCGYKEDN